MSSKPHRRLDDDYVPEDSIIDDADTTYVEESTNAEYVDSDADERYKAARKRVKDIKEFYSHLGIFIIVNGFLFLLNMLTSPDSLWFYWVLLPWGIGLAAHAFDVYGEEGWFGKDWEERKIRQIMGEKPKRGR